MTFFSNTGDDKFDRMFFIAIMQELIEYKFGVSDEPCEERTRRIIKFFEQRHKELVAKRSKKE